MSIQAHRRSFSSVEGERLFGIQIGQELFAHGAEEALDFAAPLGLIRRRVNDQHADGGGDARQLRAAIDLGVVHVETDGHAAGGDGLAQAVQAASSPWLA